MEFHELYSLITSTIAAIIALFTFFHSWRCSKQSEKRLQDRDVLIDKRFNNNELRGLIEATDELRQQRRDFWDPLEIYYEKFKGEQPPLSEDEAYSSIQNLIITAGMPLEMPHVMFSQEIDSYTDKLEENINDTQNYLWLFCKKIYPKPNTHEEDNGLESKSISDFDSTRRSMSNFYFRQTQYFSNEIIYNYTIRSDEPTILAWLEVALCRSLNKDGLTKSGLFDFGNYVNQKSLKA